MKRASEETKSRDIASRMIKGLTSRAMRANRWIAGLGGAFFIVSSVRRHDYWGTTFGTLIFIWIALRFPFSDLPWASTVRRITGLAFVIAALIAVWVTVRG